ncbi:MAG: hypothetical protein HYY16_02525 [Planctomycetes bacterium]|nr:hypothetical protein [Planctomycetota bacterium]
MGIASSVAAILFASQFPFGIAFAGFTLGFSQWVLIRRRFAVGFLWVPLSGAAWLAGCGLATVVGVTPVLDAMIAGVLVGGAIALVQGRLLRRAGTKVRWGRYLGITGSSVVIFFLSLWVLFLIAAPELPWGFATSRVSARYWLGHYAAIAIPALLLGAGLEMALPAADPTAQLPRRTLIPEAVGILVLGYLGWDLVHLPQRPENVPGEPLSLPIPDLLT